MLLLAMPDWLVMVADENVWPNLTSFTQCSVQYLWSCEGIAGEEPTPLNLFLETQLARLDHLYLELFSALFFIDMSFCCTLQGSFANQI